MLQSVRSFGRDINDGVKPLGYTKTSLKKLINDANNELEQDEPSRRNKDSRRRPPAGQ